MSENEQIPEDHELPAGCELAIASEAFYITNMILAPGLGFIMLLFLRRHCLRKHAPAIALNHIRQTLAATFLIAVVAAAFTLAIYLTGGFDSPWFWHLLAAYIVVFHIPLSWFGVVGLGKALSGENYRYPLVGMPLRQDDAPTPHPSV
ncbi:MAG: hypothetical protein ABFS23_01695 [Pseudomonadota bacterium]